MVRLLFISTLSIVTFQKATFSTKQDFLKNEIMLTKHL